MWSVKKILGFILMTGILAGCGGGSDSSPENGLQSILGGPVVMTSHKFTPPGYPWNIIIVVAQKPSNGPSQDSGTGEVTLEEDIPPPPPEEAPPAAGSHTLVSGSLIHPGYTEGNFLVEARPATPCGEDLCADLSAMPISSVKVVKPGYFALVLPRVDAEVFVVATYSHPTEGTSTREHHLGAVSERVNGIVLDFSPEAQEPELSPEDIKALGDMFAEAQDAQESLNDMIRDAIGSLSI